MRDPKKGKSKPKAKAKAKAPPKEETMEVEEEENAPSTSNQKPTVWQPGVDDLEEDEELEYDPSAYDCYFKFQLEWPCLSFDILKDNLGGPRSAFPHTAFLVAGTQAPTPRQNCVAFVKLANLDQGKHGKRAAEISDDEDEDSGSDADSDMSDGANAKGASGPARFHYRLVPHMGGINRIRSMPQQPGVVAVWGETGAVRILDGSKLVSELAAEEEPTTNAKARTELKPLAVHTHSSEGFALDWSRQKAGRLASGDCRSKILVWEPQEGGSWQVGTPFSGHKASVEDVQWSPMEETVLASCSVDKTIRIWDTRERAKPMLTVEAADCDVNVISWNRVVTYMLASGADDGSLRIWDLRSFSAGSFVSTFKFHKAQVTSVEWSPYEGSMVASAGADNQLAVWDLALERDPEEEAALAPEDNAVAPEDLPAQLLFLHAGQQDLKELRWHSQIPGLIMSTAADSFNVFKAANM